MITEFTIAQEVTWDKIVRSFENYDVFYLPGYAKAFMQESVKNGEPRLIYYENGRDRAINVVFLRDIAEDDKLKGKIEKDHYYDIITPYGYGGFWGSVSDWKELNDEYVKYCILNGYVCEFVRFELFSEYYNNFLGEIDSRTHNVVRSLEMPLDAMWMDFKQKVRKNVKKANSYGLQIIAENTTEHLDSFLQIYYSTMTRSEAEEEFYFSKKFFETIAEMKDNIEFFYVVYEGQIVSTELVIFGAENCYSYLGGTDRDYFDLRPNDFLKYEIIKWAKEKGLKNFVLGGGYGSDDGIFQYKLCLAPHGLYNFYIGRRVFDVCSYDRLVNMRERDSLNEEFFPLYRSYKQSKE